MPQLDPSTFGSQLFWLAVCFVTLYVVLSVLVLPRIGATMAKRSEQLDGDLAEAEALRAKAEAALEAYEEALAQARTKALVVAQTMRAEVQAETARQKAELDAKLAEEAAAADSRLAATREAALAGLRDAAKDIVGEVMLSIGVDQADDKSVEAALDAASGR
ncbi:MAG: F0F1 ATP synthase subunit B' [Parvibaculales bacterium]